MRCLESLKQTTNVEGDALGQQRLTLASGDAVTWLGLARRSTCLSVLEKVMRAAYAKPCNIPALNLSKGLNYKPLTPRSVCPK